VQHADVKLITRYWLPTAAATAVSIGLAAPAHALLAISGVAAGGAQAATNIGLDAHVPGIGVSFEPPLSPASQQNAVRKAQDYLNYTAFSRQGLITQLVNEEQFSTDDATYAVDSLNVDWNKQAAKKAKDYLDYTAFSHDGLLNQLIEDEKFTPSQAEYGVAAVGL
jgi:Host cell surface-exposed lipoprotein